MEVNANGAAKTPEAPKLVVSSAPQDYNAGLTRAMAAVWDERAKYSVLSETFFALTRVWEQLCAQRDGRHS